MRELENAIARAVALSGGGEISSDVFEHVPAGNKSRNSAEALADYASPAAKRQGSLRDQIGALERTVLLRVLTETEGNQSEAARRLEISESAFRRSRRVCRGRTALGW